MSLVGESGCGKSTTARCVLGLVAPDAGSILFRASPDDEVVDVRTAKGGDLRTFRQQAQSVFQDPFASLNPRMTVEQIVAEPLVVHRIGNRSSRSERVRELLELVGLTYLCIAHDLSVVHHVSDDVAVMYLGRIVEQGPRDTVFTRPRHPYTQALLSAAPVPDPETERVRTRIILEGDLPSPSNPPLRLPVPYPMPGPRRRRALRLRGSHPPGAGTRPPRRLPSPSGGR